MQSLYLVLVYSVYAGIAVTLTIVLARILAKNGAVFLEDVFAGQPRMAEAVNSLLVVGFYLINLGYAALIMRSNYVDNAVAASETLAEKLGQLLLSLAVMHFFNLYLFHRIRRRGQLAHLPPPVAPQMRLEHPLGGKAHP